jgi:hypothetical protein
MPNLLTIVKNLKIKTDFFLSEIKSRGFCRIHSIHLLAE